MTQSVQNRERMLQLIEMKSSSGSGLMMTHFKTTRMAGSNMRMASPTNSPKRLRQSSPPTDKSRELVSFYFDQDNNKFKFENIQGLNSKQTRRGRS